MFVEDLDRRCDSKTNLASWRSGNEMEMGDRGKTEFRGDTAE